MAEMWSLCPRPVRRGPCSDCGALLNHAPECDYDQITAMSAGGQWGGYDISAPVLTEEGETHDDDTTG